LRLTANFARPSSVSSAEGDKDQGVNETGNDGKKVDNFGILELIYTPGVDTVAEAISSNKKLVHASLISAINLMLSPC
jgi:hypothetical protein